MDVGRLKLYRSVLKSASDVEIRGLDDSMSEWLQVVVVVVVVVVAITTTLPTTHCLAWINTTIRGEGYACDIPEALFVV
ncbi:hypothetical protein E2C01_002231 [Portunus trituberculatus]|uniref:Uncharacterized protein n=1 Tax=Portunus trituberculatus TaxID=210409 RepID=A0A5B7CMQ9_PORTR|nr:hypothetical protein [Portunus trituberculatus]